jgi:hypothetical protein
MKKICYCLLFAAVFFSNASFGKQNMDALQLPQTVSRIFNFNPSWRLAKGSYPPLNTDDSGWDLVSTPHTYHENFVYQGAFTKLKDAGAFTYRKHFVIPADYAGRKLFLEFEGVRQRGQFYLNGHLLGHISDGVTPFGFDITPYAVFGAENILHVEIDCNSREFGSNTEMCWFFTGFNPLSGGISRNVYLHVKPKVYATLPLYSGLRTEGTYIYSENISTEKRCADIGVEIQVQNDEPTAQTVACEALLVDNAGKLTATLISGKQEIAAGKNTVIKMNKTVNGLYFWQPGYPFLYDVYIIVHPENGKPDVSKITTGFRKMEVRDASFYLNNRLLMTHGYTPRSQNEFPAVGSAYPDWVHDFSNNMMREGLASIVRWEHIMPSPQDIRSCDRAGLLQIVPGADRENDSQGREWEMRVEIMRNTIIYCRNNPSVILWEAANNVLTKEHTKEMIALRDKWDSRGYKRLMGGRSESPEWVSWMYGVRKEKFRLSIDTEYMRDESPRRWWDAWSPPYFHTEGNFRLVDNAGGWDRNQDNMCVMQSIVYEQYYNARPGMGESVCSGGVQILFADSESFTRSRDSFRRSGTVDGMRIPKDAFFCNQTMWSNTPELWTEGKYSVFIPGHWNYPAGVIKPVYVFASPGIEQVALRVNGKIIGGGQRTNTFLFTFPDVVYQPGKIEAAGFDATGKQCTAHAHETTGEPVALRMKIIQHPDGLIADGSDLALVETETIDNKGRRTPLSHNTINYRIEGPAVWRGGIWEEDVPKYAGSLDLPVINGIHRVIVRSTTQAGKIKITASSEGLKQTSVTLESKDAALLNGYSSILPAALPAIFTKKPHYGPDLQMVTYPAADSLFENEATAVSASGESVFALSTIFEHGVKAVNNAQNGSPVYSDRPWVFNGLPPYLIGADYLQVANDDASASAGEGVVFKIGKAGRVYVAYDDGNIQFPVISSPTGFTATNDKIYINNRPHTIYRSYEMNGGELTYMGTNSWAEKAPQGVNNYVIFITSKE